MFFFIPSQLIEFLKESYLPVFVNLEYKFHNTPSTPYLFLKGGY